MYTLTELVLRCYLIDSTMTRIKRLKFRRREILADTIVVTANSRVVAIGIFATAGHAASFVRACSIGSADHVTFCGEHHGHLAIGEFVVHKSCDKRIDSG